MKTSSTCNRTNARPFHPRRPTPEMILWLGALVASLPGCTAGDDANGEAPARGRDALGSVYHVAPYGDDGGPGTQEQPFQTIARGMSALSGGDTLLLMEGVYDENIDTNYVPLPSGTSWESPTTVAAYPGHHVTLRCPYSCGGVLNVASSDVSPAIEYVVFDGIRFEGDNATHSIMGVGFGSPPASHVRITNSELVNAPDGYFVQTYGDDIQFINNKLRDSFVGSSGGGTACNQSICWGYPFYWSSNDGLIEGNEISNFPSYGIHMYLYGSDGSRPSNNVVRNNTIHDFSTTYWPTPPPGAHAGGDPRGTGILMTSGTGNIAYNNVVYNGSTGIALGGHAMEVYNNTVYNMTSGYGGIVTESCTDAVVRNNIFHGSSVSIYSVLGPNAVFSDNLCGTADEGCEIVADPNFVDVSAHDFRLLPGSPAIDAGTTIAQISADMDGNDRPSGSAFDIGAYEVQDGDTPPGAGAGGGSSTGAGGTGAGGGSCGPPP